MNISTGDVVTYGKENPTKFVIIDCDNHEDAGSTCYDRTYYVIPLDDMLGLDSITIDQCQEVRVAGMKIPFTLVEGEAPFRVKEVRLFKFERKRARSITVYE